MLQLNRRRRRKKERKKSTLNALVLTEESQATRRVFGREVLSLARSDLGPASEQQHRDLRVVMKSPTKGGFRREINKAGSGKKLQMMTRCHGDSSLSVYLTFCPLLTTALCDC